MRIVARQTGRAPIPSQPDTMAEAAQDWSKVKKTYLWVGVWLFFFTIVTIALAKIEFLDIGAPGLDGADIFLGLVVASTKSTLVALIFMHLNHEKGLIYKTLLFTFLFFLSLMLLTLFALADPIRIQYDILETATERPALSP